MFGRKARKREAEISFAYPAFANFGWPHNPMKVDGSMTEIKSYGFDPELHHCKVGAAFWGNPQMRHVMYAGRCSFCYQYTEQLYLDFYNQNKENIMTNPTVASATALVSEARAKLEEAEAALKRAQQPKLVIPTSAEVIIFSLQYEGKTYRYAARKVRIDKDDIHGDRWFTTGSTCPRYGYTTEHLAEKILAEGGAYPSFTVLVASQTVTPRA